MDTPSKPHDLHVNPADSQQANASWSLWRRAGLVIALFYIVAMLPVWFGLPLPLPPPPTWFSRSRTKHSPSDDAAFVHYDEPFFQFPTTLRIDSESKPPIVRGFPSTGGILMLPLDIAVAKHLGLPRLSSVNRDPAQADEDAFCKRLRLLGAKWWDSEWTYWKKLSRYPKQMTAEEESEMVVGWPSATAGGKGGAWVLRAGNSRQLPRDLSLLYLCLDMDERCALLERWGATFYEDAARVPEFERLLE